MGGDLKIRLSLDSIYRWVPTLGLMGVELFFVLSGFLIGNILIRTFMKAGEFSMAAVRNFWVRRWMRTLPVYWLILTVDIVLYRVMGFGGFEPFKFLYYFFLQNIWYPHPLFFFGEAWSLSIEEWFYITLPIVLYLSARIFKPADKVAFLFKVFVGYVSFFILLRFINAFSPAYGADQDANIRKIVVFRLDAVMYGVLFAWLSTFRKTLFITARYYFLAVGIVLTGALYYLLASPVYAITASPLHAVRFVSDAFLYALIPLSLSLFLPFANNIQEIRNKWLLRSIQHISKISYSIYLVHYSLVYIPFFYRVPLTVTASATVCGLYMLYWAIVIVLASLLYRFFELPILQWRDRVVKAK